MAHLARLGRKLSVTLDRAQRKRCEFLILEKPRKDGNGVYEQVFLRTETAVRAHKTSKYAELSQRAAGDMHIVIDSSERYAWTFPGANVRKRWLPVGDFAELKGLHQQLAELSAWPHAALVIEAQYADFGNPAKIGQWPAAHLLRVLGELPALFPMVQCVFADNCKLANVRAQHWFAAVQAAVAQPRLPQVAETVARYDTRAADGGLDSRIRFAALHELPEGFAIGLPRKQVPDAAPARIKRIVDQLCTEGRLRAAGHGPGTRWWRQDPAQASVGR